MPLDVQKEFFGRKRIGITDIARLGWDCSLVGGRRTYVLISRYESIFGVVGLIKISLRPGAKWSNSYSYSTL
ncbi:hypothetical protein RJ639_042605 [Escallonia herrerae]|uniref:Uncharacterized protein n=1 Tax=Escallonia herrerae TaxID=1293975 RepID=A0AA88WIQ3_9ASTE|nr:hypothetical protein RJ639_042605 [Escallonia herrerae]